VCVLAFAEGLEGGSEVGEANDDQDGRLAVDH
jgi:hypothetical protein